MRRIVTYILLLAAFAAWGHTYKVDEIPNVQIHDRTQLLSNPDNIVNSADAARINALLLDARQKASVEIMAVMVDDIDGDIDNFATELFNTWGLGKKDKNNGILIIVAKDSHQATIRTGYGAEGVLPDILAGRIVHDVMIPKFKNGDFSSGLLAGVEQVYNITTDPDVRDELMSQQKDNYGGDIGDDIFNLYLWLGVIAACVMLAGLLIWLVASSKKSDYEKYTMTTKISTIFWVVAVLFVFIPIVPALLLWWLRRRWRNRPRKCPHCGAGMCKLDEDTDNQYLNMAQDLEERLNSVDYDVWLCPQCGETDIYSFVNPNTPYKECPKCHAHAMKLSGTRVIQQPTTRFEGKGEMQYTCLNCHNRTTRRYTIPPKPDVSAGAVAGAVIGSAIGRGGGGIIGGGFGGGLTGGGGATGRW